jgi:hypothetical protein
MGPANRMHPSLGRCSMPASEKPRSLLPTTSIDNMSSSLRSHRILVLISSDYMLLPQIWNPTMLACGTDRSCRRQHVNAFHVPAPSMLASPRYTELSCKSPPVIQHFHARCTMPPYADERSLRIVRSSFPKGYPFVTRSG